MSLFFKKKKEIKVNRKKIRGNNVVIEGRKTENCFQAGEKGSRGTEKSYLDISECESTNMSRRTHNLNYNNIRVFMYNFETLNSILERSHRPSINRMKKMGKESGQEVSQPLQGPREERRLSGKHNHYFFFPLKFPLLLIKTTTLLEVRKHFQYASLCRFGNSTLERIQFGRERSQGGKKKKRLHKKQCNLSLMALTGRSLNLQSGASN